MKKTEKKQQTGIGAKGPAQTAPKISATKSALQRIESLETQSFAFMAGVQQGFESVQKDMSSHTEFIEALVDLAGKDKVIAQMTENRIRRATEQMEAMKAKLEAAVLTGEMLASAVVTANGLLVGVQRDAAGQIVPPGRVQVAVEELQPDEAALFKDKTVGDTITFANGGSFEIIALFEPNPEFKGVEQVAAAESAPAATVDTASA